MPAVGASNIPCNPVGATPAIATVPNCVSTIGWGLIAERPMGGGGDFRPGEVSSAKCG